jgi:glycosyltransferase involved in cell wall biosynthesis
MWRKSSAGMSAKSSPDVDVCLIAEGCYPYVAGGVSTWTDWLIRAHPHLRFSVLAVLPGKPDAPSRYPIPDNLVAIDHVLLDAEHLGTERQWPRVTPEIMADLTGRLLNEGNGADFSRLLSLVTSSNRKVSLETLLNSQPAWETMCHHYGSMSHSSFLGFFWAWRTLVGGLYRVLTCPLPQAKAYHAVSTGYAGLIGARAAQETGRPFLLTEHGIYSNERRIEILMADWIASSIENGLDLADDRKDIRELWARSFESFARVSYHFAQDIVALYEANQTFQLGLGADPTKLRVIPNGVDVDRFGAIDPIPHPRPTIAFIGRVTPIKDVQTFIDVAERLRRKLPDLSALIIGPMDEDPEYAESCVAEVQRRGLADTVTFTGSVNVADYLGSIDVLVLTSISEALPLVILEAGAAGVPCVATDVGACREIIEGPAGGMDGIGAGGAIASVGAGDEIAALLGDIFANPQKLAAYGRQLQQRVLTQYRDSTVAQAYNDLYAAHLTSPKKVA